MSFKLLFVRIPSRSLHPLFILLITFWETTSDGLLNVTREDNLDKVIGERESPLNLVFTKITPESTGSIIIFECSCIRHLQRAHDAVMFRLVDVA